MLSSLRKFINGRTGRVLKHQRFDNISCPLTTTQSHLCASKDSQESNKTKSTLYRDIMNKILACGAMTVAEYMSIVSTHPMAGYYMNRDVFGQKGDFITSPEISQLFGEMLAVWIINEWQKISRQSLQLVELGPGRGTLSADILRIFKRLKITNKVSLCLVEVSPALSKIQAENLCISSVEKRPEINENQKNSVSHYRQGITRDNVQVFWYHSINDVPKEFSVFIAHEFFDALPIHKFQKINGQWNEILIDIDPTATDQEKLRYVMSRGGTPAAAVYISENEKRNHVEVSPQSLVITDYMSSFLEECGGFALIIDYGHDGEKMDTFRAFHRHKLHDPLLKPGIADLTADVDFSLLKKIASKDNRVITFGPVNQADFLKQLQIEMRLEMLLESAPQDQKSHIESGYHMITDEDKMGTRFKVLSLFPAVLKEHLQKWPVVGFQKIVNEATK